MENVIRRVEEIAETGVFGDGQVVGVEESSNNNVGDQFMSVVSFFNVKVKSNDDDIRVFPIFVKIQMKDVENDAIYVQFTNEVIMYDRVLKEIGAEERRLSPKMYFSRTTNGERVEDDILILEDLRPNGYVIVKDVILNDEHIFLAMKKLGQFHGLSYKMKMESPDKLKSYKLPCRRGYDFEDGTLASSVYRGFKYFLDEFPDNSTIKRAYDKLTNGSFNATWEQLRRPEEPFAVIVHGDYTKNNVMFKYDDSARLDDMILFDFGTSNYSDPAVDVATFLFMHSWPEFWASKWDDALGAYWDGVTSVAEPGFSLDEFKKNLAKRAIFGYLPNSFFKPFLFSPEQYTPEEYSNMTNKEREQQTLELGGEEGTKMVTDIVRFLFEKGYLEEFVNNFDYS